MKRLLIFTLGCFLSVLGLSAQTEEESMLFDTINAHRAYLGLNKLVWDSSAYTMASYHAHYLTIIDAEPYSKGAISHDEKYDIPEFDELSFEERCNQFIPKKHPVIHENCAGNNAPSNFNGKGVSISVLIFSSWMRSTEGHKENVENKEVKKGACSIKHCRVNMVINGKIIPVPYVIAVLDIY